MNTRIEPSGGGEDIPERGQAPPQRHVFRDAEKTYARRVRPKNGTRGKLVEEVVDLSDVVDFSKLTFDEGEGKVTGHAGRWGNVHRVRQGMDGSDVLVYSFDRHPGFFIVRRGLDEALASRMAVQCLGDAVLRPPATTNFNKSHGLCIRGLWDAAMRNLRLVDDASITASPTKWACDGNGKPASEFLASLRWASIGPCYDWTRRVYLKDQDYVPLPDNMKIFAERVWALVGGHAACGGAEYRPNAALINYYREGDKLCGHVDDAEIDQKWPLVSISLGCPAVFLMGGESKDVVPTPILLRHGDVAVLSGAARRAHHGLPRIFPANREHQLVDSDGRPVPDPHARESSGPLPSCVLYSRERCFGTTPTSSVEGYLRDCRINISIRQV